jgi:hypothetical protein
MQTHFLATITALALSTALLAAPQNAAAPRQPSLPRTADGKPNLQGIWQASSTAAADLQDHGASLNMLAGRSVVVGGEIPYQQWAARQKAENFRNRLTADPLSKCFMPGVPRAMYLDFPFQIFQTPKAVAITFEWQMYYRLIYTDDSHHFTDGSDFWMGDSRGRWEGDTLVVDVANFTDGTWLDMAGDFHSGALHVVERYRMTGPDTIQYQATMEDAKVFTKAWTINIDLHRRTDRDRLYEYVCRAEEEEASGAFTREPKTWYPGDGPTPVFSNAILDAARVPAKAAPAPNLRRTADAKPDLSGFFISDAPGANQRVDSHRGDGAPLLVDPPDGKLPLQPWAVLEQKSRSLAERGYDDPTAHCFPQGVPRMMYIPDGYQIVQTPDYIVLLHERLAWRIIPLRSGAAATHHLPDNVRLWQGDSIGHWEGDTLVIDTTNLNGKEWLSEGGDIMSYAEHVVERITPTGPDTLRYEAAVSDPVVYARPWTIAFPINREKSQLREETCLEDDHDLPHLKAIKDAAAAKNAGVSTK